MLSRQRVKRTADLCIGSVCLLLTTPLMFLIGFLVTVFLGSPILFRQRRPGLNGKPFTLLKFRTMTDAVALNGTLLADHERVTTFGRFLRSTSLDELPELMNVVRGE